MGHINPVNAFVRPTVTGNHFLVGGVILDIRGGSLGGYIVVRRTMEMAQGSSIVGHAVVVEPITATLYWDTRVCSVCDAEQCIPL